MCRKPKVQEFTPFCSAGCKDRDLLQWLGEGYRVPGPPAPSGQLMDHFDDETGAGEEQKGRQ